MKVFRSRGRLLALVLPACLFGLAGCADSGVQEVRQWMADTKKQTRVVVQPLSPPKKFIPFAYGGKEAVDPYNPAKLLVALAKVRADSASNIKAPDETRRREVLESFPLDVMKMVGTIQDARILYALVQVDKTVFKIKLGNYIGQNVGLVTKVSDTEIEIKETVQDATGDWIERKAKLELQEAKK